MSNLRDSIVLFFIDLCHFKLVFPLCRFKAIASCSGHVHQAEHVWNILACSDKQRRCDQVLQEIWVWDHRYHTRLLHQHRAKRLLCCHQVLCSVWSQQMMTIHHLGKAILSLFVCSLKNLFLMSCFCFLSFACFDDLKVIDSWLSIGFGPLSRVSFKFQHCSSVFILTLWCFFISTPMLEQKGWYYTEYRETLLWLNSYVEHPKQKRL